VYNVGESGTMYAAAASGQYYSGNSGTTTVSFGQVR
jgi:hypothetical protein